MTTREVLKHKLDTFTEDQLCQVANFMDSMELGIHEIDAFNSLDDTPKEQVLADFRQAWHEALTGQGTPIAQLWQELKDE